MTSTTIPVATTRAGTVSVPKSRDVAFDYLRATLTVMVVAHHSALAYTTFAHFNPAHYQDSTAPVVDSARWLFFDYAENFNDVFFMSLMFFISGLFVWPSLRRAGAGAFLRSRLLRLGAPFAVVAVTVMPLAYYASWQMTGRDSGFASFWRQDLLSDGLPTGPLWFVWVLLLFDSIATALFMARPKRIPAHTAPESWTKHRPMLVALVMLVICAIVYLPALKAFGFGAWVTFLVRPFYFQACRLGLYLVWFLAGAWVGRDGLDRGLLALDGALARHRRWWIAGAIVAYNVLVIAPRAPAVVEVLSEPQRGALEAILWLVSCVASCFGFLALFRRAVRTARPWMESLARSAYAIYLLHYLFVLWAQRELVGLNLPAGLKFLVAFALALGLSWASARALLLIPALRRVL